MKQRIASESDAARRATLQTQLQAAENNAASQAELKPTPPNITLQTQMTLYRGNREIQIRFLGRAHTAGVVVVFLPKEKIVITGDMLTSALSNMSDAFVNDMEHHVGRVEEARFRGGSSRSRRSIYRQNQNRLLPGLPSRCVDGDQPSKATRRVCRGRRKACRSDEAQGTLPNDHSSRSSFDCRHTHLRTARQ